MKADILAGYSHLQAAHCRRGRHATTGRLSRMRRVVGERLPPDMDAIQPPDHYRAMRVPIERTRRGYPALWESGGGYTNTGRATIIAAADGNPKKAVYVRRRGHLACGQHALVIIEPGDYVIRAGHHRGDFTISVLEIVALDEKTALLQERYSFDNGEWSDDPPEHLHPAIRVAREKARCYHCRSPHFIQQPEPVAP